MGGGFLGEFDLCAPTLAGQAGFRMEDWNPWQIAPIVSGFRAAWLGFNNIKPPSMRPESRPCSPESRPCDPESRPCAPEIRPCGSEHTRKRPGAMKMACTLYRGGVAGRKFTPFNNKFTPFNNKWEIGGGFLGGIRLVRPDPRRTSRIPDGRLESVANRTQCLWVPRCMVGV